MMIRHIVMFRLADKSGENIAKTAEILRSMEERVPMLRGIEVGTDFLHSARSCDILLQVTLDDREALEAYQKDEYHCSVVKKHMHAVTTDSYAVDYDI